MDTRMSNIASPMPQIRAKFTNKLGIPLSGCKVYTYEPNSDIPKTTWLDTDKTTENTNPILLDAAGEADIFLDGLYRVVVKDRFGFVVYDVEKTGNPAQWDASFVVDGDENQHDINKTTVRVVDSIHKLLSTNFMGHKVVRVSSYWPNLGKGGNTFVYDANMPRNKHNGGTIIDPTKAWDGTRAQWAYVDGYLPDAGVGVWGVDDESKLTAEVKAAILARGGSLSLGSETNPTNFRTNQIRFGGFLGASTSTGFGCWVAQTKEISFTMFGAVGDAAFKVDGTDDSYAMLAAVRALPSKNAVLNLEQYFYTHGNADIRNIVLHFKDIDGLIIKGNLACIQSHSQNLPVTSQAIMRFDYVENATIFCLNTDARLDSRMVVGGDANTNNDQHNFHIGAGCRDLLFFKCRADRAMMDGFYVYGGFIDDDVNKTEGVHFFECHADECYRQGSSLITGLDVKWTGGSYTNTGTCKDIVTGVEKGTSPMRGIDVEANDTTWKTRAEYEIDGVLLKGNKNAGFSASNNGYGTIQNSFIYDNEYIGILVEYNAKNTKVINNKFKGNSSFDLWLDCTHPIKVMLNDFKTNVTAINAPDMSAHDTSRTDVYIGHNNFEPADGSALGGGIGFDHAGVVFDNNTMKNMLRVSIGGTLKFSYTNNKFISSNASVTSAIFPTWAGVRFKEVTGNTTVLVSGSLIGSGYNQANIDLLANNDTNTDPNSGLFEVHKGQLIWNSQSAPAVSSATTVSQLQSDLNAMRATLINQGIWK